jgi:hypothetical protein
MQVNFRFYAELNDFLPPERRMRSFAHTVFLGASVKDLIESLGVPHTEVDLILVNSAAVGFVSVYPAFAWLDVSSLLQLRPPLREFRFVVDTHLGRLATYLRMLTESGFLVAAA